MSSRSNNAHKATIDRSKIYGVGAFKNVYLGEYTAGERRGEQCVSKEFRSGSVFESSYFAEEMKNVSKTLDIVRKFNDGGWIDRKILVNTPEVWVYTDSNEKSLIEPLIENFQKFNSNTGWYMEGTSWAEVMQALSHFSYDATGGNLVLCDVQGGIYSNGAIITDPRHHVSQHRNVWTDRPGRQRHHEFLYPTSMRAILQSRMASSQSEGHLLQIQGRNNHGECTHAPHSTTHDHAPRCGRVNVCSSFRVDLCF